MIHFAPSEDRLESTRTRVLRDPELVPIALIRPTNEVSSADRRPVKYSPICLVKHSDGFLYIVDGNHRFYKKVLSEKESSKIPAWILRDGDQDRIVGNLIPGILEDWKIGKITLEQVVRSARFAWEGINSSLHSTVTNDPTRIDPVGPSQGNKNPEWPPAKKFDLVIQLINDELSIEEASQKYSLPARTIKNGFIFQSGQFLTHLRIEGEIAEKAKTRWHFLPVTCASQNFEYGVYYNPYSTNDN